jgi:hypothetical protein
MPSLTEAQFGVSVSLPLNYENIDLIFELINTDNLRLYLSGLNDDLDEAKMILCVDDEEELESLEELLELENEEEFKNKYEELEFPDNLVFHFIYLCIHFEAFDIQYRSCGVFQNNQTLLTPVQLIERIQNGIKIFTDAGVSEELLKVGTTLHEDYD